MSVKSAFSVRMDSVVDMATYAKRSMRTKPLDMTFHFLFISWIIFLYLSPEIRRFTYSGIRWEYCEVTWCSSLLGEYRVAVSRLTSLGNCALLELLTW